MLETFHFIDIWFVEQHIKKWFNTKICSFYDEFENEKKQGKICLTFPSRDLNPQVMFDPLIWISQKFDGDGSKSKNVTKTDRSLSSCAL